MKTTEDNTSNASSAIILFGGTFNPIHYGHITPVLRAAEQLNPEKLIYLPCNIPPHKTAPSVTSQDRFNMVKLAIQEITTNYSFDIEVSDFELTQTDKSYSRYTIEHFATRYNNQPLYFLIGMDSLLQFEHWYKWQEILQLCQLMVIERPGYQALQHNIPKQILAKTTFIKTTEIDISSTDIREKLPQQSSNKSNHMLTNIPAVVQQYIKQNKLYLR